jgi:ribose/xylose/arabinose/galactoside ABC-type transport system permease subunit
MLKAISSEIRRSTNEKIIERMFRIAFGRRESGLFFLLVGICLIMMFLRPDTFFSSENMYNILRQVSIIAIIAVGQTFVMVSGGIDLSIGYNLGLCGIIIAMCTQAGFSPVVSIAAGDLCQYSDGFFQWINHY